MASSEGTISGSRKPIPTRLKELFEREVMTMRSIDNRDLRLRPILHEKLATLGWLNITKVEGCVSCNLVKSFYEAMNCVRLQEDGISPVLETTVRGTKISINVEIIARLMEIPIEGRIIDPHEPQTVAEIAESKEQLFNFLSKKPYTQLTYTHLPNNLLKPPLAGLGKIVFGNILPENVTRGTMSRAQLLVLYCIEKKIKVSLPHIIIQQMLRVIQNPLRKELLGYGVLIMRMLYEANVNTFDESTKQITEAVTTSSIFKTFVRSGGVTDDEVFGATLIGNGERIRDKNGRCQRKSRRKIPVRESPYNQNNYPAPMSQPYDQYFPPMPTAYPPPMGQSTHQPSMGQSTNPFEQLNMIAASIARIKETQNAILTRMQNVEERRANSQPFGSSLSVPSRRSKRSGSRQENQE